LRKQLRPVIINAPDHIILKTAVVQKVSTGSLAQPLSSLPTPANRHNVQFLFTDDEGKPHVNKNYIAILSDGTQTTGKTDEHGKTEIFTDIDAAKVKAHLDV